MGFLVLDKDFGSPQTIMVYGAGRSGTSVASGCLRLLGVNMGDNPHPLKHEWSPIVYREGSVDIDNTVEELERMNNNNMIWGWKSPADFFALGSFVHYLRRPAFLVVTRDVTDITISAAKAEGMPILSGIYESAMIYGHIFDRLRFIPCPKLVVSYEFIVQRSEEFARGLASFLSLTVTEAQLSAIAQFSSPRIRAYRSIGNDQVSGISEEDLAKDSEVTAKGMRSNWVPDLLRHLIVVSDDIIAAAAIASIGVTEGSDGGQHAEAVREEFDEVTDLVRGHEASDRWDQVVRLLDAARSLPLIQAITECCAIIRAQAESQIEGLLGAGMRAPEFYNGLKDAERKYLFLMKYRMMLQKMIG